MKNKYKITFSSPHTKDEDLEIDAIRIYYPYKINRLESDERYDKASNNYIIMVSISGSMALQWGYSIWQNEDKYVSLSNILIQFAIRKIKAVLESGKLKGYEEVKLMSNNAPPERPLVVDESTPINKQEIIIEI
jgi:hypothetical protein